MEFIIPTSSGGSENLMLKAEAGCPVFILGANGSGKSALIHNITNQLQGRPFVRLSAQRQNWLNTGNVDLTAKGRRDVDTNENSYARRADARYVDYNPVGRIQSILFDLVANENARARRIATEVSNNNGDRAKEIADQEVSPIVSLNRLLKLATLSVSLEYSESDDQFLASHSGGSPFSIAALSDGERNAVLIAAAVITAEADTVIVIDEPERHLHRSIIVPFLSALFDLRQDCPFVVATHEVSLPDADPSSVVLLSRSCSWSGGTAVSWDLQLLEPSCDLPEETKSTILGARKRILFVEGHARSLDKPLYTSMFPAITVIDKGSCEEVRRAVAGLKSTFAQHNVEAFGLIDRDDRTDAQVEVLSSEGVYALSVHSAESLYYSTEAISAIASSMAKLTGDDPGKLREDAILSALSVLKSTELANRMARRRCERKLRDLIAQETPSWRDIPTDGGRVIQLSVSSPYPEELKRFNGLIEERNWEQLISRFPLRETSALEMLTKKLGFAKIALYEQAVLSHVAENSGLCDELKGKLKSLTDALQK